MTKPKGSFNHHALACCKAMLLISLFSFESRIVRAEEALRGAAAVLKSVAEESKAPEVPKLLSESAKLRAELTNFTARAVSLAPAEAAKEWLALFDRVAETGGPQQFNPGQSRDLPLLPNDALAALPPPAAWDELVKAISARPDPKTLKDTREFGLRMLGEALIGNHAALAKRSGEFEAVLLKANREESMQLLQMYRMLDSALRALSDDPKTILAGFERSLTDVEKGRDFGYGRIEIPDLAGIVGEKDATPYIRRALISKARDISIEGKATKILARKIALTVANDLQVPRWSLVDSLDATALYEAMAKKFDESKEEKPATVADRIADMEGRGMDDYERQTAKVYYLMGLIVSGRIEDAAKAARRSSETAEPMHAETEAIVALERAGFTEALNNFLFELLSASPELPYWEMYFGAAAKIGKTDRMLALARAAASKPELDGEKGGKIRENLSRALLAADLVDEGIAELRALLAKASTQGKRGNRSVHMYSTSTSDSQSHALALANLGRLLEKPEWINEGLAAASAKTNESLSAVNDYQAQARSQSLERALVNNGRLAEAEKLLADSLAKAVKLPSRQRGYPMPEEYGSASARGSLTALASFYHKAGRNEDVLVLLDQSPHWGAKDLAALFSRPTGGMDFDSEYYSVGSHVAQGQKGNSLLHASATALFKAGRKAEARAIVDWMLNESPGDDRAYELLIQLVGPDSIKRLDELFARDQFEERPLIWKAMLLHQAGKDEEAEKIARQAIAIDPSDGEQGKGDRMRVYSVLADIREARGNPKDAEFFRGVVKAIRLSESADDFMSAGLLTRAVKMYEQSLTYFADAYCIQSRLAVHLTELGQHDEAAKHYEKAFELMPDSFGRVESHCFGCESTFAATQAQGVAERVFTKLVAKNPNQPQIHYLLGYLRKEQGRGNDSLIHFRRAVELDPDYLNAWVRMSEVGRDQRIAVAERDAITLNILRLDPLGRHTMADLGTLSDFRKLWAAVETSRKYQIPAPTTLLSLTASREALEKQEREAKNKPDAAQELFRRYYNRSETPASPGQALAQHPLITAIAGLMGGSTE